MDTPSPNPSPCLEAKAPVVAGLPAYSLFAFFVLTQVTVAGVLQLASIPWGLAFCEAFLFAAPAVLLARSANWRPASFLRLRPPASPALIGLGLLAGAANFLVAGGLQILGRSLVPADLARRYDAAHLFQGIGGAELGVLVVALGLFAPLCEEIGFRGWIQPVLRARHSDAAAVAITAVLFAALHLDPIGMAARVELGALFGLLALWTRSLWPAIAAHAANNLIAAGLLVHALGAGDKAARSAPTPPLKAALLALAGLAAVALILFAVRKLASRLPAREPEPEPLDPSQADHEPRFVRVGAWIPAWIVSGMVLSSALLLLRWTNLQVAITDAASGVQDLEKRLPDDEARAALGRRLVEEKLKASAGKTDLEAYKAMRKRVAALGKPGKGAAGDGPATLEQVEAAIAGEPDAGGR